MRLHSWRYAILHSDLPATTRHVLLTIDCHLNDVSESARPTLKVLEEHTGLTKPTLIAHLKSARELGWLELTRNGSGYDFFTCLPDQKEVKEFNLSVPESGKADAKCLANGDHFRDDAIKVLEYLNKSTGRNYHAVDGNLHFIVDRLKEGFSAIQMKHVVFAKVSEWGEDQKMSAYLRPATLFNKEKFAGYVGEIPQ